MAVFQAVDAFRLFTGVEPDADRMLAHFGTAGRRARVATSVSDAPARAIATVCLSGTLEDKLAAAAAAGFDGIEIFEPDLIASPLAPGRARRPLRRPRPVDRPVPAVPRPRLHRRRALRAQPAPRRAQVRRDGRARHRHRAGLLVGLPGRRRRRRPARRPARGRRRARRASAGCGSPTRRWPGAGTCAPGSASWDAVRRADSPALGLCLDSFHVLSRGGDPAGIRRDPRRQVLLPPAGRRAAAGHGRAAVEPPPPAASRARAPSTSPPSSRTCWPPATPARSRSRSSTTSSVSPTRAGPPSTRCARCCGWRSGWTCSGPTSALRRHRRPPRCPGYAFTELAVDGDLGTGRSPRPLRPSVSRHTGQHRSKPVQLWEQGERAGAAQRLRRAAGGSRRRRGGRDRAGERGPGRSAAAGRGLLRPGPPPRRAAPRRPTSRPSPRPTARRSSSPAPAPTAGRPTSCPPGTDPAPVAGITAIDHVALTQPFDSFDEAALFYRSVLGLEPETVTEYAAPFGLVRSRAVTGPGARSGWRCRSRCCAAATGRPAFRLPARRASPPTTSSPPREALRAARRTAARRPGELPRRPGRAAGSRPGPAGGDARVRRSSTTRTSDGELPAPVHRGARLPGVLRGGAALGGYDGYGSVNAPVRMAAHRRLRTATG